MFMSSFKNYNNSTEMKFRKKKEKKRKDRYLLGGKNMKNIMYIAALFISPNQ